MNTIISSPLFPHIVGYAVTVIIAIFLVCYNTFKCFDLATPKDILADKLNDPWSFYDGTYELPKGNIAKALRYANYSYHSFWNAIIIGRFRCCLHVCPHPMFRVNKFLPNPFPDLALIKQVVMIASLAFIWGYPLFLLLVPFKKPFDWGYGV